MAVYTKQSGDDGATPSAAKFWREETRYWFLKIKRASLPSAATLTVHASQADAEADANVVASGSQAVTSTIHTVTLANGATAPTFSNASITITFSATTWTGTIYWKVDQGQRLERSVLRVLRGFKDYIDGTNSYTHTLGTVELGPKQWEDVERDDAASFPYVAIGRAAVEVDSVELGAYPGPTRYRLRLAGVAHNKLADTADSIDSNGLMLFHDLRRSLVDLNDETYTGDGAVYQSASISLADFDRPLEWARDRVSVYFDVTVLLQETRAEMVAG